MASGVLQLRNLERRLSRSDLAMPTDIRTTKSGAAIWDRVMRNAAPSPIAARALLQLQFPASDRERMRDLAAKARAGTLTPDEEWETDAYERLGCLLDILHSKARRVLKGRRRPS